MTRVGRDRAALIWCPFPDRESARRIAAQLLDERLVACANILGAIESLFLWDSQCQSASETGVLFKTGAERLEQVVARLGELHPYDTPAILGWRTDAAWPPTVAWLAMVTQPEA